MQRPLLFIHGGAGQRIAADENERREGCAAALAAGWEVLAQGGAALDAVAAAVMVLEDLPFFNAGVGSCLTLAGEVEMDASIMDGNGRRAGAVGAVRTVCNPVRLARAVMDDGRHVLMVGSGAEAFGVERGIPTASPEHFITPRQRDRWAKLSIGEDSTVGAVALDVRGSLSAATSTGGLMRKLPGRIGDSSIIGAGTYADDRAGAASATGRGEAILLAGLAKSAVDLLRDGSHPKSVAERVVIQCGRETGAGVGIILIDRFGRSGSARNTPSMLTGFRSNTVCEVADPE